MVAVSGKLLVITQHFYCCSIDTESLLNLYLHTTFSFNVSVEIEFGFIKEDINYTNSYMCQFLPL